MLENAFKNETVGLVTRAEFVEKRDTIAQRLQNERTQRHAVAEEAAYPGGVGAGRGAEGRGGTPGECRWHWL